MLGACIRDLALDLREERDVSSRLRTSSVSSRHLDIYQNLQPQHTYTLCTLVGWSFGRSVRWTRSTRLPRPSAHFLRFSSLNGAHFRRIRHQIPLPDLPHTTGGTLRSLSPNLNQPENTPSEHCTARSLPALPVTVAQTRRSDDPLAISATDFITKIINISQNRTKYATTTSNFFLSLDQQRRYTQRTSTTTTGTDSHWMAGASPHQHYQARLYFLHLTLLHFSALSLSLFSLDVRSSSTLASSVLYTTLCVHTTTSPIPPTQRFDSSNPASCSLYPATTQCPVSFRSGRTVSL